MLLKDNPTAVKEKAAAAPPPVERVGEGVKAVSTTSAAAITPGRAPDVRASSANGALPAYVPARRRSRRNLLL